MIKSFTAVPVEECVRRDQKRRNSVGEWVIWNMHNAYLSQTPGVAVETAQVMVGKKTPAMKEFPLSKVYQLLEPGPVVLLTTAHKGRANIMTMSWHMMAEFEPPLFACVVSNADFSFVALRATKECVIAIPALELAPRVVGIGNCSGRARPNHQHHARRLYRQTVPQCLIVFLYG